MRHAKLSENHRGRLVLLALLATLLLSVGVGSAYYYQIDANVNPSNVYINTGSRLNIEVYDMDHSDWVFPNANITIMWTEPNGMKHSWNTKTNSTGQYSLLIIPNTPGNYTFVVSSTYDYNTTPYIPVGMQSALSVPVNITSRYMADKIGVFRNSTHIFYLDFDGNGAWNGEPVDKTYNFGIKGDTPLSGDWQRNGLSEIGVYRPSTHVFYLDYNGNGAWNGASVDRQYNFGLTGDIPVSGDWNADGRTEIGVFRPSTHVFYLDYNGNGAWNGTYVDLQINFGLTGDIPVAGDWNADGRTDIGVFRPSTHVFYLDYNGNGIWNGASGDRQYNFGLTGDSPVTGDWNADGRTEIGVYRNSTHLYYLDYNGNGAWNGVSVDRQYNFGITGDKPVAGKWGRLNSPVLVSPSNGSIFSNYPRYITYTWNPVIGATGYSIQTQYWSGGIWRNTSGGTVTVPSYSTTFVGANPGRWRVTALDSSGLLMPSVPSSWWEFRYTV